MQLPENIDARAVTTSATSRITASPSRSHEVHTRMLDSGTTFLTCGNSTGNCWDNAVAESFFSSLKKERIKKRIYKTRDLARADIFDYIEMFYNPDRRHSHLGGVSPEAFERASI